MKTHDLENVRPNHMAGKCIYRDKGENSGQAETGNSAPVRPSQDAQIYNLSTKMRQIYFLPKTLLRRLKAAFHGSGSPFPKRRDPKKNYWIRLMHKDGRPFGFPFSSLKRLRFYILVSLLLFGIVRHLRSCGLSTPIHQRWRLG